MTHAITIKSMDIEDTCDWWDCMLIVPMIAAALRLLADDRAVDGAAA